MPKFTKKQWDPQRHVTVWRRGSVREVVGSYEKSLIVTLPRRPFGCKVVIKFDKRIKNLRGYI